MITMEIEVDVLTIASSWGHEGQHGKQPWWHSEEWSTVVICSKYADVRLHEAGMGNQLVVAAGVGGSVRYFV